MGRIPGKYLKSEDHITGMHCTFLQDELELRPPGPRVGRAGLGTDPDLVGHARVDGGPILEEIELETLYLIYL